MSGGFFRGTSAEQDTRFSNKQAKLMKSQKFAPELENLVDMTKVKMDVMRPWIANRVTEYIGFEDEVLINFIYGLLEGKVVNGKEIQISITGFMERNTGKFMKELWVLLLSAQNNASGVPQQFLDAKEEESKKKKAESDRLMNEIQRRKDKESHEREEERYKKTDAGNGVSKASVVPSSKDQQKDLASKTEKQTQHEGRNGFRGRRSSKSPLSADRSSSPRGRRLKSVSRSMSNSKSNSRSRSKSVSISPKRRRRPSPSESRYPRRVSQSPYGRRSPRRSRTPVRRRSSYYRRRSISQSRHSSPSPPGYRMRSPVRRRSRSPLRRRSRSPMRRRSRSPLRPRSRSPPRHQSRSPSVRARSPFIKRRSPATIYRRSPLRYRSPSPQRRRHRGSPSTMRRRSPSPLRRRSPSPLRRRSPSPLRRSTSAPKHRKSASPATHKSSLPRSSSSSSHSRSASPVRRSPPRKYKSPVGSSRERTRVLSKSSDVHDISPPSKSERVGGTLKRGTPSEQNDSQRKATALTLSPHKSLSIPEAEREISPIEAKRSRGLCESPTLTNKGRITGSHIHSPQQELQDEKSIIGSLKKSNTPNDNSRRDALSSHKSSTNPSTVHKSSHGLSSVGDDSSKKISGHHSDLTLSRQNLESSNKDEAFKSGNKVSENKPSHQDQHMVKDASSIRGNRDSPVLDKSGTYKKTKSHSDDFEVKDWLVEPLSKLSRKVEQNEKAVPLGSSSEESDQKRGKVDDNKKNKRPRELESEEESSIDSYEEERKDAKRKRKEEKKLRKEERRRKRHDRRRKREERHAKKKTLKSADSVSSASDTDGHNDGHSDDDRHVRRRESRDVDMKEAESDQKKLEMQLREKALESLRAKKSIGH